ncbi:hypothetical protein [Actinotalea ferrariae]|uniref:hypothetical protein n=1 Tax=Actinotalea ferrariae TaxID=1386098 RepID=UPI0027E0BF7C|nr:hypothetical protein [Actinotalea ferrariae]
MLLALLELLDVPAPAVAGVEDEPLEDEPFEDEPFEDEPFDDPFEDDPFEDALVVDEPDVVLDPPLPSLRASVR